MQKTVNLLRSFAHVTHVYPHITFLGPIHCDCMIVFLKTLATPSGDLEEDTVADIKTELEKMLQSHKNSARGDLKRCRYKYTNMQPLLNTLTTYDNLCVFVFFSCCRLFFRRHYPINTVTYCDTDPQDRK